MSVSFSYRLCFFYRRTEQQKEVLIRILDFDQKLTDPQIEKLDKEIESIINTKGLNFTEEESEVDDFVWVKKTGAPFFFYLLLIKPEHKNNANLQKKLKLIMNLIHRNSGFIQKPETNSKVGASTSFQEARDPVPTSFFEDENILERKI